MARINLKTTDIIQIAFLSLTIIGFVIAYTKFKVVTEQQIIQNNLAISLVDKKVDIIKKDFDEKREKDNEQKEKNKEAIIIIRNDIRYMLNTLEKENKKENK